MAHPGASFQRELHRIVASIALACQRGNAAISERVVVAASGQLTAVGRQACQTVTRPAAHAHDAAEQPASAPTSQQTRTHRPTARTEHGQRG